MTALVASSFRFARAFQSRSFTLLWIGQTVSRLGDFAFTTALAWQVLLLTHSGTTMGLVLIASSVPQLLFLLIGGLAADRLPKRLVLLCSDSGRAIAVLSIALLGWLHLLQFWHLMVLALIFGIAQGFFFPAYQALPPQLVEAEQLSSANALTGLSRQVGTLFGPVLGAVFIAGSGPALAFAFDGITFMISSLCLLLMGSRLQVVSASLEETEQSVAMPQRGLQQALSDMREGLGYVVHWPWLWVTILIASLGNVVLGGTLQVAFPLLIKDVYHAGAWLLGVFGAASAGGSMLGTLLVGQLARLSRRGLIGYLGLMVGCSGILLMSLPLPQGSEIWMVIGGGVLFGAGLSVFDVIWVTVLQERVPMEKQGRVFSIDALGSLGLLPIGYALLGVATDAFGPAIIFLVGGILTILLCLLGLGVRSVREIE